MDVILKNLIYRIKKKFEGNPDSILIGEIREGNPNVGDGTQNLVEYIEFLKISDGAYFGEIILFSSSELAKNQFYVETLQGEREIWLFIGHILYEPIVINKVDGKVYRFYRDVPTDTLEECFGSFDNFLKEYAFSRKYSSIVPVDQDDEWVKLLTELNMF